MKKIILSLCSIVIAITMFLPAAVPVMADSGKNQELTQSNKAELNIRMVEEVDVGQPLAITVFTKHGHNTVSQAMVYALNLSQLNITADNAHYNTTADSYADVAVQQGLFLGFTGDDGKVECSFQETGRYAIIATKDGFIPAMDYLTVNLAAELGLLVRGPDSVVAGKNAIFKITERNHGTPVDNAVLYAMKIGDISMPEVLDSTVTLPYELDNIDEIRTYGIFMGYSNNGGIVRFQFKEPGNYIVFAIKDGYAPGRHKIMVTPFNEDSLIVRVPDSAEVNEEVTIIAVNRGTGDAVSGAAIYAMKGLNNVRAQNKNTMQIQKTVAMEPAVSVNASSSNQTMMVDIAVAYPSVDEVKESGIFLGYTNDEGQVNYAFEEAGRYVIVAVAEGYNPGFGYINIKNNEQNQLYIRIPETIVVNQEITIGVVERNSHEPVEDAAVYVTAVSVNGTTSQLILQADEAVTDNGTDEIPGRVLIGYTDDKGQVVHTFTETGRYSITAVKDDYVSGSAAVSVLLSAPAELKVYLPARARIDERVTIKVLNRYDGTAEEGASVYSLEYNTAVSELSTVITNNETETSSNADIYAEMARSTGMYIGDTDENGEVTYAFNSTGQYLIVVVKEGFVPGFSKISILGTIYSSLLLRVQDEAKVNVPVIMATVDRATSDNVSDVDIYAYKIEGFAASLGFTFREAFSFGNTARQNLAMSVSDDGFYIGTTDESGHLEYTFNEEGHYLLIAFKAEYSPDFERIEVISTKSE